MTEHRLTDWLPTTKKEVELRGWDTLDVILFSADAYVDHPSFGAAVIGRILEAEGLRVAIVTQPNWRDDLRDFKKLGRPRLFFGIAPGCMDSMVNKYTANRRLRSEDAYTPDGRHDLRPEYPTIVYTQAIKRFYPDVPVVLGGIEASMRRVTHYDYWQERLRKCILADSGADMLIYGMGERPVTELCRRMLAQMQEDETFSLRTHTLPTDILQTAYLTRKDDVPGGIQPDDILLHSHEECLADRRKQAENIRHVEEESNRLKAHRILQPVDGRTVVVNPPYPPMTQAELDHSFDLPYTRREVKAITRMPDFKGYLSDLGGPSANMYGMGGRDTALCSRCSRPSCIHPKICPNLNTDHRPLLDIYRAVDALPGIRKSFIGSGVRYDLLLRRTGDEALDRGTRDYTGELIRHHVSGRLKVAPEHTSAKVLRLMRKPPFEQFYEFKRIFDRINRECGLKQQIIPYFISSHPGCTEEDMAELAVITKQLDFHLEQIQDFTPTPMTISTETWYTGYHPYTLEPVFSARTPREKLAQRMFFFWYKPEERTRIVAELRRIGRSDLIDRLYRR